MGKIISVSLPRDLPENWNDSQFVSPGGLEVGLTEQHGYNYLMKIVNTTQLAVNELDEYVSGIAGNKNILHNWYLIDPIDTKEGYIIPASTNYYSSETMSTAVGTTPYVIVPDYIGETYASYTKSGTTFYVKRSSLARGYIGSVDGSVCIDRWRLKSNGTLMLSSIEPQSSSCKLILSKVNGEFYQDMSNAVKGSRFGSLTYTFSVKVDSVSDGIINLYISDGTSTKQTKVSAAGLYSVSIQAKEGASKLVVGIKNTHATNAGTVRVTAAKLEVGARSTLAYDPPADRAEQMAICIQFDPNTNEYRGFTSLATANILANASVTE